MALSKWTTPPTEYARRLLALRPEDPLGKPDPGLTIVVKEHPNY
jgi:hypothetical protein